MRVRSGPSTAVLCALAPVLASILVPSRAEAEFREILPTLPPSFGTAVEADTGRSIVETSDGGHVVAVMNVQATTPSGTMDNTSIVKYAANGTMQWSTSVTSRDGSGVTIRQGSGVDQDIYVAYNFDGWAPSLMRLGLTTGAVVWNVHPQITSYAFPPSSGNFDLGGPVTDIEFRSGLNGLQEVILIGTEGRLANNLIGATYMPAVTRITRANGAVAGRVYYGVPVFGGTILTGPPVAVWPVRIVRRGGTYQVFANVIEATATGLAYAGATSFRLDATTLAWTTMSSVWNGADVAGIYRTVLLDVVEVSVDHYVLTGYVEHGPIGGKDAFVADLPLSGTFSANPSTAVPTSFVFHGSVEDDVATSITRAPGDGYLVGMTVGPSVLTEIYVGSGGSHDGALLRLDAGLGFRWARRTTAFTDGQVDDVSFDPVSLEMHASGGGVNDLGDRRAFVHTVPDTNPGDALCGQDALRWYTISSKTKYGRMVPAAAVSVPGNYPWNLPTGPGGTVESSSCTACSVVAGVVRTQGNPDVYTDASIGTIGSYALAASYAGGVCVASGPGPWSCSTPGAFYTATLTVTDALEPLCVDSVTIP